MLTPNDELFVNWCDGLFQYSLKGEVIQNKSSVYKRVKYLNNNQLLISMTDGRLMVWNYKKDNEIISEPNFFNLKPKVVGDEWFSSKMTVLPNTNTIVVTEGNSNYSKLWDYSNNTITQLDFDFSYNYYDSVQNDFFRLIKGIVGDGEIETIKKE